jgi:hypothetical protein
LKKKRDKEKEEKKEQAKRKREQAKLVKEEQKHARAAKRPRKAKQQLNYKESIDLASDDDDIGEVELRSLLMKKEKVQTAPIKDEDAQKEHEVVAIREHRGSSVLHPFDFILSIPAAPDPSHFATFS